VSNIWTLAKKELRGYFGSPVAIIFLGAFLLVVLFTFFWIESFLARGVADIRPMFDWMPILLIVLVSSLAMRLWSEEERAGTIEVLLTLPVPRWQLVLGKFVAGMILVAVALGLTLGVPITVAIMGNLDWGPVFGGYVAALLLAAAYLSIGMCVSAVTDSQIVALIGTALVCGLLYLPGAPQIANYAGGGLGDFLRAIGSGSRFSSVARGVLDLRDLAYYASLVGVFLGLNAYLLGRRRSSTGPRTRMQRTNAQLAVALAAGNALLFNLWLSPVAQARVDLTQSGEYSLSPATEKVLASLDEPLLIRAYFSQKTHPKLEPLRPLIVDLLDEYRAIGGGKVRVEVVDPSKDEQLEKEAKEEYGVESVPIRFASRTEQSVVNAFFHIVVAYGDHYEVLGIDDLIEVRPLDVGDVDIRLRNFEYDLTRTIKKVATGFQSVDALFASMPGKVELTEFITPGKLPDNWKTGPETLDKVVAELTKSSGGKLEVKKVEPSSEDQMKQIFATTGIRPYASFLSRDVYYFHILIKVGDRAVRVNPPENITEVTLRDSLTEALKRAAPGFTKVVAVWAPPAPPPMPTHEGMPPQRMPAAQSFERLKQALSGTYEVRPAAFEGGRVGDDVDLLILAGPDNLDAEAVRAVDQFLMRGGAVIILDGRYRLDRQGGGKLAVEKVTTGLEETLAKWGIDVRESLVLDTSNEVLPFPKEFDRGDGVRIRRLVEAPYPPFLKIEQDRVAEGNLITAGVPGAVMHWASPVKVTEPAKGTDTRKIDVLLRSTGDAWLDAGGDVDPANARVQTKPAGIADDQKGQQVLAVAITGGFPSALADKAKAEKEAAGDKAAATLHKEPLIEHSPPDARLVVFGSSSFVSDDLLGLAQQIGSELALANVQLVQNAVDWALADTDLLSIRARTTAARALTTPEAERGRWLWINFGIAFAGLGAVVLVSWLRRRSVRPIVLPEVKP